MPGSVIRVAVFTKCSSIKFSKPFCGDIYMYLDAFFLFQVAIFIQKRQFMTSDTHIRAETINSFKTAVHSYVTSQ